MKLYPLILTLMLSACGALAQTVAPAPAVGPADLKEAPIELNPFVISAGTDDGYAAAETLAGTRLKTSLKDNATALSVLTPEMLSDLGALNFNDALDFLPSTARYSSNEGDQFNNGQRTGQPFTVRGFRSDNLTANFFGTLQPIDTYNTSRLTFSRGPNSIVFSIGSPGGGLDITTNVPNLSKDHHAVSLRVDSFESYRVALDSNFVLVPGKLGLRFDLLQEDRRRYITPTKNERTSLFLASSYQPYPQTTITVNGESSRIRSQIGRSVVSFDQYSPWLAAGSPVKPLYGNTTATPGLEYNNATGFLISINGQSAIAPMNWRSSAMGTRPRVNGALNNRTSFVNDSVTPLNVNLAGNGDSVETDANSASLFVQQAIGRKLFIEIAGKFEHQYLHNSEKMGGVDNLVKVDANAQLPDGKPNPYVGLPYVETNNTLDMSRPTDRTQARLTASYEWDLNQHRVFNRRLGRLTFGGLFNFDRVHQLLEQKREVNSTPLVTTGTFGRLDNTVNNIRRRTYLTPGVESFNSDFAPINTNGIKSSWESVITAPRNNISETKAMALSLQADLLENLLVATGGVRRDQALQEQGTYVRDARGVFPGPEYSVGTNSTNDRGDTYSYGAVLNITKFLSLYANRASNFFPSNQSTVDINGVPAAPITGEGYDLGIKYSLLRGKVQGSISKFSTSQKNITDNTLAGQKRQAINEIWGVLDPNRVPSTSWADFKKNETEGYEAQLVGNPTSNLRLMLTASKNLTIVADRGAILFDYIDRNLPLWQANAAVPVTSTLGSTVGDLTTVITNEAANDKRTIGIRQTRNSEWQFGGMARYQFDPKTSSLKGWAVGSAFTWRDEPVIGYKVIPRTPLFDITQPFYGAEYLNVDAWIEYNCVIHNRRVRWESQLRVQNLLDNRAVNPWTALDDGTGGRYVEQRQLPNALGVSLSTTFRF